MENVSERIRIVAILATYNERELVRETIEALLREGIGLLVLDDGSTDGTFEILKDYVGRGILRLERQETGEFDLHANLRRLDGMLSRVQADWVLRVDQDEFVEAPSPNRSFREALLEQSDLGYNIVQFNMFEFWPTDRDGETDEQDVRKRLRHYSWITDWQFVAWRNYPGTDFVSSAGHLPVFPCGVAPNVSPVKFVKRHYPVLGEEHGTRRVFENRLPRVHSGSHPGLRYYERCRRERSSFVIDANLLTRYEDDGRWCLERKYVGWRDPSAMTSSVNAFHAFYNKRDHDNWTASRK